MRLRFWTAIESVLRWAEDASFYLWEKTGQAQGWAEKKRSNAFARRYLSTDEEEK